MIISRKTETAMHPPLNMTNTVISETQTHRHLGITLSSKCTWFDHVDNICAQAWTRLNLMRALKFRVSWKLLEKIYISFIRPVIYKAVHFAVCLALYNNKNKKIGKNRCLVFLNDLVLLCSVILSL